MLLRPKHLYVCTGGNSGAHLDRSTDGIFRSIRPIFLEINEASDDGER